MVGGPLNSTTVRKVHSALAGVETHVFEYAGSGGERALSAVAPRRVVEVPQLRIHWRVEMVPG